MAVTSRTIIIGGAIPRNLVDGGRERRPGREDELRFDDLLAELRWCDELDIIQIARALLLVCRTLGHELRRDLSDPALVRKMGDVQRTAAELFRTIDGERLDAGEQSQLVAFLEVARSAGDALAARATAVALDQVLGTRFARRFAGTEPLRLSRCDAFPVHPPTAFQLVTKAERSGNPSLRTPPFDHLPHLRIAPEDMRGIDVELVWRPVALAHLTALADSSKFAVAHAVSSPEDAFRWRRYEREGVGLFYGVQPRDAEAHWQKLSALIQRAAEHKVTVLALPELCLTDTLLDRLRDHVQLKELPLLIAGSRHLDGDMPGENEAVIFAHGVEVGRHQKFRPYEFDDDRDDDDVVVSPSIRRCEDLCPRAPQLRLYISGGWSVVVLICKDAIDRDVTDLLRALQVQLVVVPSWSDTTDDYYTLAVGLAADPQAVTLVANVPGAAHVPAALFGRPVRDEQRRVTQVKLESPSVLWFDLSGKHGILEGTP